MMNRPEDTSQKGEVAKKRGDGQSEFRALASKRFARLFGEMQRPFYIIDGKNRIRFANQALLDFLSTSQDELLGWDCGKMTHDAVDRKMEWETWLRLPSTVRNQPMRLYPLGIGLNQASIWSACLWLAFDSASPSGFWCCFWLDSHEPIVASLQSSKTWQQETELRQAIDESWQAFSRIENLYALFGQSPGSRRARRQVQTAIASSMSVCLVGSSGSQCEEIARTIYQLRRKRERMHTAMGNLLPIDCRLMDRVLMSEMVALAEEKTADRTAEPKDRDSTVLLLNFLDCLPAEAHGTLLKYLQRNPNGVHMATTSAPHLMRLFPESQDWKEIVAILAVMTIEIQPLYERIEDIAPTATLILDALQSNLATNQRKGISKECMLRLESYAWPGDVAEMAHCLAYAHAKATSEKIEPEHLPLAIQSFPSYVLKTEPLAGINLDAALEEFERRLLERAIEAFPRNRAAAARHLGMSRTRLLRRLTQLGIEGDEDSQVQVHSTKKFDAEHDPEIPRKAPSKKSVDSGSTVDTGEPGSDNPQIESDIPVFEELKDERTDE